MNCGCIHSLFGTTVLLHFEGRAPSLPKLGVLKCNPRWVLGSLDSLKVNNLFHSNSHVLFDCLLEYEVVLLLLVFTSHTYYLLIMIMFLT